MTAARTAALLLTVGLPVATVPAAEVGSVATSREGAAARVDAWLPGEVQEAVVVRDGRGAALWLVVVAPRGADAGAAAPPPGPCEDAPIPRHGELWRFDPDGGPALERVLDRLPTGPTRLTALDLDGDGAEELVALTRDGLARWPAAPGGAPQPLGTDVAVDPRTSRLVAAPAPGHALLAVSDLGEARFAWLRETALETFRTVELPVEVGYRNDLFQLDTRPLEPVGGDAGVPAFADLPKGDGSQRLYGRLVRPTLDDAPVVEWWARLPEPEVLLEQRYLTIDGRPALFVTSRPANKLVLFGEKRLRLFRLDTDRSRIGHPPFFAVETRANLWQSIVPYARDVDGDGHDDIVLAYWKGLTDSRVVLDAYLADGAGSFHTAPDTTGIDVRKGERSFVSWERDVTGDGVVDLLVIGRGRLQVHAGDPSARRSGRGRDMVAAAPSHELRIVAGDAGDEEVEVDVALGGTGMRLSGEYLSSRSARLVDLDGDGVFEALVGVPDAGGFKLSFARFSASRGAARVE